MDYRFTKRNGRGQFEAGPSSGGRYDQSFHRNVPLTGKRSFDHPQYGGQAKRNNQSTRWFETDGRQPKGNYQQLIRSNSSSSDSSTLRLNESGKLKNYICPNCKHPYNYKIEKNTLTGKVPRILPCKHTICEECIKKCIKTTNHIECMNCYSEFDKNESYEYNHYVLGQITCSKFNGTNVDFPNLSLTPSQTRLDSVKVASHPSKEKCGFNNCKNFASVSCIDCCGVYCKTCDEALHRSVKQLHSHKRVPIKNTSLELLECQDHSMYEELYCNDCGTNCCCYCFLDKHEGHSRGYLSRLNDEEEAALEDAYQQAKMKKQLLMVSSWKVSKMEGSNLVSDLEFEIAQHLADIHAQLYFLEKKLYHEAQILQSSNCNGGMLNETIQSNIETLDRLINCVEERKYTKFNMKLLLKQLKDMENLPTILVSPQNSEKPKLVIDKSINELENYFKLDVPQQSTVELRNVEEIPQDYLEEIKLASNLVKSPSSHSSSVTSEVSKNSKSMQFQKKEEFSRFKQEAVFVTHINSLDSIFVQLKEDDGKFKQLEQEIKNHSNRMTLGVGEVRMKELYLARRIGDKNKWCRVRVMEKIDCENGEKYKVKFIDFGNIALVKKDEMIYISSYLANKKPFAFECRLDNPSQVEWPKDTHLELLKLFDLNTELTMYTKDFANNIRTVVLNINTSVGGLCSVTDLLIFGCNALKQGSEMSPPIKDNLVPNRIYDNSDVFVVGNSYEVFIRHVVDPWNIYVQKTSYENSFNKLIKQMAGYYSKSNCDVHLPIKNSFVVVHHPTKEFGEWHRAKILEVFDQKQVIRVFLVDLGKYTNITWKNLRKLNENFKKSECLVVCVKLADVAPLTGNTWTPDNEVEVKEYLEGYSKRNLRMKILISTNEPLEVVLFEPQQNFDLNINAVLVEMNLASSTGKLTDTKMWLQKEENEKKEENNVLFFKDDTDEDEHDDQIQGYIAQVEMVRFDNPFSFYISYVQKKADNEKLHEEVQIHYKTQKYHHIDRKWKENEKVVVFDKSDNMYYRGIIRKIDGNKYCVNFLDKPDYIWVDSDKLRVIHPYFKENFPNCIFKCCLVNIKPAGDSNKWSNLSLEWFEMLFKKHNDIFMQKIEDDESKLCMGVTLWYSKIIQGTALEPSYHKYISIDKKVVEAGLAFWVNKDVPCGIQKVEPVSWNDDCDLKSSGNETTDTGETVIPKVTREIKTANFREWLPCLDFKTRDFFGYITCAENGGHLFVREEEMQKHYEEMEKNMKVHFDTLPSSPFTLKQNQMVTVRSDGLWYRGVVLSVIDNMTAKILMVDFGSDHIIKMSDMTNKIMYPEIPIMVRKVKLFHLYSIDKNWTESEVEILINTAPEYGRIVIRSTLQDGTPLADVYDVDGVCLNDTLAELCPNLSRTKRFDHKKAKKDIIENSYEIASIHPEPQLKEDDDEYCENVDADSDAELTGETMEEIDEEMKDLSIDQIEDENETEEEVQLKTEETEEHSREIVEKDEIDQFSYAKLTKTILEGDIIAVYDYKTISLFYPDEKSTEADFEALTVSIRESVADLEPLENIAVGQPCLSLFEEDKQWYRAKILRVDAQQCGYVTVIYVDYGNFEVVKLSDLKSMKPEWLDFPARFIDASIDYKLLRSDQENVLLKHIQSLSGETKYIKIVNDEPVLVHIYNKNNDEYELYYDVFVNNGIVEI